MGFFDKKWIVEFEYCDSFIASYKKATIEVEASSEYGAKDTAKAVLNTQHKYLKILSAREALGKNDRGTYKPVISETISSNYSSYSQPSAAHEVETLRHEREALEEERNSLAMERKKLEYERWYSSLSDEEKLKEDIRVEKEAKEKEERLRKAAEMAKAKKKKDAQRAKIKSFVIVIICIIAVVGLVVLFTRNVKEDYIFPNSQTETIANYIIENGVYNEEYGDYTYSKTVNIDGHNYEFEIQYIPHTKNTIGTYFVSRITTRGSGIGEEFEYYIASLYFNYGDISSLGISGIASYEEGYFFVYFNGLSFGAYPNVSYSKGTTSNLKEITLTEKMKTDSISGIWENVNINIKATQQFLSSIDGSYRLW